MKNNSPEEPIREELFSVERLEQFASEFAAEQTVSTAGKRGHRLLPRLEENGRKLASVYRELADAIRDDRNVSPAAEWLVDNFHIVEEQLREIRRDLPKGYYRELPKLESGDLAGYPRVYAIALAIIAHTDSRLDAETLARFVRSYQQVTPLSIGELWAIAITLRVALVENLRRLAVRIIAARDARERADDLADKLLELAGRQPSESLAALEAEFKKTEAFDRAFVVQLTQRLRDQDPEVWPALDWLEQRLSKESVTTEQIVHLEHQRQAATQVTVGNIITSMRLLSTLDWEEFFESVSQIDPILAEDPIDAYRLMDFATRDLYRHVIETIAKRTKASEHEIGRHTVKLARESQRRAPDDHRRAHVGYYLIDEGRAVLERRARYRAPFGERFFRAVRRHPTGAYLSSVAFLTALLLCLVISYAFSAGASPLALVYVGVLALLPVSDLALSALNLAVTTLFRPHRLPKMSTSLGTSVSARTFVVTPTILTGEESVRTLLEKLEVHYLANRDENIYFALLGDFADAAEAAMPEDDGLLDYSIKAVEELNARYSDGATDRFTCSTDADSGMRRKGNGLGGSESVANFTSSTAFFVGLRIPVTSLPQRVQLSFLDFVMFSRSIRTLSCLATRRDV